MKNPYRFWLLSAALLLGILLLTADGCPGEVGKDAGSLVFRFQVDPAGTTAGQLPAEAFKVELAFTWHDWYDTYLIREEEHSFQVDNSWKHEQEQSYANMATGRFRWTARVFGVHDSKEYLLAKARGEFSTTLTESWVIEVEYPLRDATLTLQVGDEDPEALIYCLSVGAQTGGYQQVTSPPIDSDDNPLAWVFSLPSGDYSYSAKSYTDDSSDYPYYQQEDWSQAVSGSAHLDPGESRTIVVDFDTQPVPDAPTGIEAGLTSAHADSIVIYWSAVPGANAYNLYWSTAPGVTKANGTKLAWVSSGYVHGPLPRGFTYHYVVTAQKGLKESAESQEVSVPIPPG